MIIGDVRRLSLNDAAARADTAVIYSEVESIRATTIHSPMPMQQMTRNASEKTIHFRYDCGDECDERHPQLSMDDDSQSVCVGEG
jgi:hypothetical protein